jgi:phosphoglycerate dehydrogenase-like enzyme
MSTSPKVVVFSPLSEEGQRYLRDHGMRVVIVPDIDAPAVFRELADADGCIASNIHAIDGAVLNRCPKLKVIGRMGVGVDNVDLAAASRHGVLVVNTPEPIIEPVAEHTLMLMLAVVRRLVVGDRNLRAGRFRQPDDVPGVELKGKTLGLVGFGNTGRRVAEIARLGFGMKILYHDLRAAPEAESRLGAERRALEALLAESDFVSVHVNLSASTAKLFDASKFRLMKPTAYFINVSRGGVVDEPALIEALRQGRIAGAGLDVFADEPTLPAHPFWGMENVVATPHRAGFSIESRIGCSWVVHDIVRVLRGEKPRFAVNSL